MYRYDPQLLAGIEAMLAALPPTNWRLVMISNDPMRAVLESQFPLVPGDDIADADRLLDLIGDLPCKLNLIPYNEIDGPFHRSSEEKIEQFVNRLQGANFMVTIRWSKGTEINGGCGQLAVLDQVSFN